jgi:hypothetical protein
MKTNTKNEKTKPRSAGYPVFRPTVSKILVCACGTRYIKTRDKQNACIPCFVKEKDAA